MQSADEVTPTLTQPLTHAQQDLLRVIFNPVRSHGTWPTLHYVQSEMYQHGHDADAIIESMPVVGLQTVGHPHYSAIWREYHGASPHSTIRLTIAAALHLIDYREIGHFFVNALKVLVERVKRYRPSPVGVDNATITASELKASNDHFVQPFIDLFPEIIRFDPFGLTGSFQGPDSDGEWRLELKRELLKYDGIDTVEDYVRYVETRINSITPRIVDIRVTGGGDQPLDVRRVVPTRLPPVVDQAQPKRGPVRMHGFDARIYTLFIASPGDTTRERDIVEQIALEVNASQLRQNHRGLYPYRWERDSVAGFGDGPQSIINEDGDTADIVIALFRARAGTQTALYASGSIEEVERAVKRGVKVHVVFLDYGAKTSEIDPEQLKKLKQWKESLAPRGLFEQVEDEQQLRTRLRHFLERDLHTFGRTPASDEDTTSRVEWRAWVERGSRASAKLAVSPSAVAEEVKVRIREDENSSPDGMHLPILHTGDRDHLYASRLPVGQALRGALLTSGSSVDIFNIRIEWVEGGQERSELVTVSS